MVGRHLGNNVKNASCLQCKIADCYIQKLSPEWKIYTDKNKEILVFPANNKIFYEQEKPKGLHFIYEGKVKVFTKGNSNTEKIYRLAGEGDILGHRGLGADSYPVSAVTLESVYTCFINNESLLKIFHGNPSFTYEIMLFLANELRRTEFRSKIYSLMNVRERLILSILYVAHIYGSIRQNPVTVKLSRQLFAGLAESSPEVISRAISQIEEEGLISRKKRLLIIDKVDKLYNEIKLFEADILLKR